MSSGAEDLPRPIDPAVDDAEMASLIESWRRRGPAMRWDAVVGHHNQIRRCQELVDALSRSPEELERLHVRIGRGLVLAGPSGTGKTLIARCLATAIGRDVIVPPTAELTAPLITRLYAQLARMDPVVVILDEAEGLIGRSYPGDSDETRALCVALDGIDRPDRGPVTLALTTASPFELSPTATRPGRLAPRLDLSAPTFEERITILERAMQGVPAAGEIDVRRVAERTATWTGAELVTAIEEAVLRSLPERVDALREDLLLDVIQERYVIDDERPMKAEVERSLAEHEAGHALYAHLTFPGKVAVISLSPQHGRTMLAEDLEREPARAGLIRNLAATALAGMVAEQLLDPSRGATEGSQLDRAKATQLLVRLNEIRSPIDAGVFEQGGMSDRGSERMRAELHAAVTREGAELVAAVSAALSPYRSSIERLAESLLEAPDHVLSGDALQDALAEAIAAANIAHAQGAPASS